jgi:GAF domain-containing protein
MSIKEAHPEGRGACGMAFRSGAACIINDYLSDSRCEAFHAQARKDGTNSGASFPLFERGQVVGMLVLVAAEKDIFTPEFTGLLQRLARKIWCGSVAACGR